MSKMPIYPGNQYQRMPPPTPPEPEKPKYRFRVAWVLVPLVCIFAWWILSNVSPVFGWDEIMSMLSVVNTQRYTKLACLFAILLAVVCIVKIIGSKDNK